MSASDDKHSSARRDEVGSEPEISRPGRADFKRRLLLGAIVLAVVIVAIYGILSRRAAPTTPPEAQVKKSPTGTVKFLMEQQWLIRMKLAKVEEQTVARQITSTGRVVPAANGDAHVAPPVSGILAGGRLPRVGQKIARGQVIAVIQQTATSAEQAQVRAAQAQVQAQNAQVAVENARLEAERRAAAGEAEAARVRLELAQQEAERAKRLYEKKAYSQKQLQGAEAELGTARAGYDAAVKRRDALAAARAIAPANTRVGNANASHTVYAPLAGYVTKVHKSIGEQVAAGETIVEIANLDTVWVEAPIFEADLGRLAGNVTAAFTTSAYPDQEFVGKVVDVGAVIDERTRAATVVFEVPNPTRELRIGMQANVKLNANTAVTAMMIPREAVLEHEGKKIVYVLLSGEEFQRREVTIGDEYGGQVAVLSGLSAGERVVTQGALQLKLQELKPADAGAHTHET